MSAEVKGTVYCPCCGTGIKITAFKTGLLMASVKFVINDDEYGFRPFERPELHPDDGHTFEFATKEEESPEGNLRPDSLPEGIHAPQGGSGETA